MENIGDSLRKPVRRRSHARRPAPNDCVIDMAEARREIAHALHLRRSLSSSSSAAAAAAAAASCFMNRKPTISGNRNSIFGGSQYCYSVMESMPLPEPIWSTTAPSILAAPAPPAMEAPEFEWGENQASYTVNCTTRNQGTLLKIKNWGSRLFLMRVIKVVQMNG
jgi:hypothetical protein